LLNIADRQTTPVAVPRNFFKHITDVFSHRYPVLLHQLQMMQCQFGSGVR